MERIRSMSGVEIYRTSDGLERVGIVYGADKRRLREMVGDVTSDPAACADVASSRLRKRLKGRYRDCPVCLEALRRLDTRRAEVRAAKDAGVPYLTPKERAEADAAAREAGEANRTPLSFENCAQRFLAECAEEYTRPGSQRDNFRMLSRYFAGRTIDTIRKADVLAYFEARLAGAHPFADLRRAVKTSTGYMVTFSNGHPQSGRNLTQEAAEALARRPVSPRAPETEISSLSAMFNYLLDEAEDDTGAFPAVVRSLAPTLSNPCIGWRPRRRRKTKAAKLAYKPKHRAIVPTPEELGAILAAAANARQRALWGVAYYTFSRPESETCQLRMGDVLFSDDARLRFENKGQGPAMGRVTFRDTKTGEAERVVYLHPVAEGLLKAMKLPARPGREAGESEADYRGRLAAWEALPIFARTKGPRKGEPWDRASYRDGWRATVEKAQRILWAANPEHRDIRPMWLRDTRKGGITAARSQGQDPAVVAKLAGHSTSMGDWYMQVNEGNAAAAIACLPAPVAPVPAAGGTAKGISEVSNR